MAHHHINSEMPVHNRKHVSEDLKMSYWHTLRLESLTAKNSSLTGKSVEAISSSTKKVQSNYVVTVSE